MTRRLLPFCGLLTFLLTITSTPACFAADDEPDPANSTLIDRTHRGISESLSAPARWFDNFFHNPRIEEEPAGTFLRLRGSIIAEEDEKLSYTGKAKARLRLPNLKRRFDLILSSEDENLRDETLKDARINRELAARGETSLALQFTQTRSTELTLTHQVGLDLEDGLNPRIRSRVRYAIPIADESIMTLAQAIYWENEEGFGEESRVDYDLPLRKDMLLRATGQGFFSESSNGYEWLGMLQWLQSFSHKKALAVGSYVAGETRPQNQVSEYDAFLKYRQRIIKKWLFVELRPEVKWSREKDFKATGIFTLTFEVQFDD